MVSNVVHEQYFLLFTIFQGDEVADVEEGFFIVHHAERFFSTGLVGNVAGEYWGFSAALASRSLDILTNLGVPPEKMEWLRQRTPLAG